MIEDLEQLFKIWKQEQINNKDINKYFCKDGYIDKEEYDKSKQKILFILKEPDVGAEIEAKVWKEDNQIGFYEGFFNKENYKINTDNEIVMKNPNQNNYYLFDNFPRQKEKIARIAEYIFNKNITDDYEILKKALKKVAFMNLNKSGGYKESDKKYFLNYCNNEIFSNLIIKEIDIINPTIIVLIGGNSYKGELNADIRNKLSEKRMFSIPHTSARGSALNINKNEKAILDRYFGVKYNYKEDLELLMNKYNSKSEIHMRKNRCVFKYLLKFIATYEEENI